MRPRVVQQFTHEHTVSAEQSWETRFNLDTLPLELKRGQRVSPSAASRANQPGLVPDTQFNHANIITHILEGPEHCRVFHGGPHEPTEKTGHSLTLQGSCNTVPFEPQAWRGP